MSEVLTAPVAAFPKKKGKEAINKPLGDGLYFNRITKSFLHRFKKDDGKESYRKLDTTKIGQARDMIIAFNNQRAAFLAGVVGAKNPLAPDTENLLVGELIEDYRAAKCPMGPKRDNQVRTGKQLAYELKRLLILESFWKNRRVDQIKTFPDCHAYAAFRRMQITRTKRGGGQSIQHELCSLSAVFSWAINNGKVESNIIRTRPSFVDHKNVRHCREAMPKDGEEFIAIARHMFNGRRFSTESLAWQVLLEGMTGGRTCEILACRTDATDSTQAGFYEPGKDSKEGHLWLNRAKDGINPWVFVHPALAQTLEAFKRWRVWRGITSPWFIVSKDRTTPVVENALTNALLHVSPVICGGRKITSHGFRAFYVTVLRSMGMLENEIAFRIGDSSGSDLIKDVYGAIPPGWTGGPKMTWLPEGVEVPWAVLGMPENITPLEQQRVA